MRTVRAHRVIRPPARQRVALCPTRAGHVLCMHQWGCPIQTPLARMNLNRRVQWNKIQTVAPECPPPHFGAGGVSCEARRGGGETMTTPSRKARHPSVEGNFIPRRYVSSSPPLEGWAQPGVVRECVIIHLLSILCHSRARGPHKYECICGVDKAGIGSIKFVLRILDK